MDLVNVASSCMWHVKRVDKQAVIDSPSLPAGPRVSLTRALSYRPLALKSKYGVGGARRAKGAR